MNTKCCLPTLLGIIAVCTMFVPTQAGGTPPSPAHSEILSSGAKTSASYTNASNDVSSLNDNVIIEQGGGGRSRWTNDQSPNTSDWVQFNFGKIVTVGRMVLYLWNDGSRIQLPKSFTFQYWDGKAWQPVKENWRMPTDPILKDSNSVGIVPVQTNKVRVIFDRNLPGFTGATEWQVWSPY